MPDPVSFTDTDTAPADPALNCPSRLDGSVTAPDCAGTKHVRDGRPRVLCCKRELDRGGGIVTGAVPRDGLILTAIQRKRRAARDLNGWRQNKGERRCSRLDPPDALQVHEPAEITAAASSSTESLPAAEWSSRVMVDVALCNVKAPKVLESKPPKNALKQAAEGLMLQGCAGPPAAPAK